MLNGALPQKIRFYLLAPMVNQISRLGENRLVNVDETLYHINTKRADFRGRADQIRHHDGLHAGSMSRSFYVGEELTEEDIKAKLEHGVLSLQIPKKEAKPQLPEKKYIAIEG